MAFEGIFLLKKIVHNIKNQILFRLMIVLYYLILQLEVGHNFEEDYVGFDIIIRLQTVHYEIPKKTLK